MLFRWQWTCYWCWIFCGSVELVIENYKIWIKLDLSFPLFHFSRRFLPQDKDIQNSRYVVDPKFCHFVRLIPSVAILCPNMCRRIILDLVECFISYFGRRRCQYDTKIFQFPEIEDFGVTHRQHHRRQATVVLNVKKNPIIPIQNFRIP